MANDETARRYHRVQLLLGLLGLALTAAFLAAALWTGAAHALARWAASLTGVPALRLAVVAGVLGLAHTLLGLPLAMVRRYWLPRRHGLLHQPLAAWLGDWLKGAALGAALGLASVEVIYALLRWMPGWWWLAASAVFVAASAVMTMVLPVWVLPLFYRLTPLGDAALRERLLGLARRLGVPAVGVWVADQSRKSRTANAMLAGLGRTRRIILFDTLVDRFTPDEIESVLAHELGHHVNRDHGRGLLVQALLTVASLWVADRALGAGARWLGLASPADPAGLPWLGLVMLAVGLVAAPLANGFSRWIERQADDFSLRITGNTAAFIGAMERLAGLNLAERRPHRLKEIMLHSHPAIDRRIARAREAHAQ